MLTCRKHPHEWSLTVAFADPPRASSLADGTAAARPPAWRRREGATDMATDLVPSKPSALTDEEEEIARLMVYGLPHEEVILGKVVKPDWPLTLEQAAKFVGYRLKRARTYLDDLPAFSTHRRELLAGKRTAELPRNLMTAIEIRDDPGENSAADRTVRLKAIGVIEGNEGKGGVIVNVNQQTTWRNLARLCDQAREIQPRAPF